MARIKAKMPIISSNKPFLKPITAPKTSGISSMISRVFKLYALNKFLTTVEMALPSAFPASALLAAPITFPIS